MGCAFSFMFSICAYTIWPLLATVIGMIIFVLRAGDVEVYRYIQHIKQWKLLINFVYKLLKYRHQGQLCIPESLVYVATGADERFSLTIAPKNHRVTVKRLRIEQDHLRAYKESCGYQAPETGVPVCYAETLFFKLIFCLVTSEKFCLCPLGLIHIRQTITQNKPLEDYLDANLAADADVIKYRKNNRGVEVDIRLRLFAIGERGSLWEGVTTLFSRARPSSLKSHKDQTKKSDDKYMHEEQVDVAADAGLVYAKLTGDWNPHHLYPWSARLLRYERPIAHGMWTLSRAIAHVQSRYDVLQDGKLEVKCAFKRPLFLPGRMRITYNTPSAIFSSPECEFFVHDARTDVPHIEAQLKSNC